MFVQVMAIEARKLSVSRRSIVATGFIVGFEMNGSEISKDTFVHFVRYRDSAEPTPLRLAAFEDADALIRKISAQHKLYAKPAAALKITPPSDPEEWNKKHVTSAQDAKDPLEAKPGDSPRTRRIKAEKRLSILFRQVWEAAGYEVTA